ncbi:DUF1014-domain-containing protein [Martensiomyces pterosporus]|nr:DUF1014-domain-containing protein [Martensiomyces pterosporus]
MPKKFQGENSKVTAAKEKKAAAQAVKDSKKRAEKEAKDAAEWTVGSKKNDKKEQQEAKRLEKLAKKKEAEDLLREENKGIAKSMKAKTGPPKLAPANQPGRPAPALRGSEKKAAAKETSMQQTEAANRPVETFAAQNIDDALELLDTINTDSAPGAAIGGAQAKKGGAAALVDRHPERRAKAAYKAFEDRELDRIKADNPGLRLNQAKQILWKEWQKSPENPFNQAQVAHNAKQEEIDAVLEQQRQSLQDRLRIE